MRLKWSAHVKCFALCTVIWNTGEDIDFSAVCVYIWYNYFCQGDFSQLILICHRSFLATCEWFCSGSLLLKEWFSVVVFGAFCFLQHFDAVGCNWNGIWSIKYLCHLSLVEIHVWNRWTKKTEELTANPGSRRKLLLKQRWLWQVCSFKSVIPYHHILCNIFLFTFLHLQSRYFRNV